MNKRTVVGVLVGALTLGGAGVAVGQGQTGPSTMKLVARDAPVTPPAGSGNYGASHQHSIAALRAHLEPSDPTYLADADWDSARSFMIPGTQLRGWTFEQPAKRCLALPDPIAEGYGITCNTRAEIAAGRATVLVRPPAEAHAPNIVGALVSATGTASISVPSGTASQSERIGDVYVGTAPSGSRLVVASRSLRIDEPVVPEVGRALPRP